MPLAILVPIARAPKKADEAALQRIAAELFGGFLQFDDSRSLLRCERFEFALPCGGVDVLERVEFGAKLGLQRSLGGPV